MNSIASRPVTAEEIGAQARRIAPATQAAGIEHSRAIAEVQAAVLVAQNSPRNEADAIARAKESCGQMAVAESAFFSFKRGGSIVSGPTIGLATELARCWGNIDYGIMELSADAIARHTEMLAFAWDLETNTKSRQTFIVPWSRDTKSGQKSLTDMRDIYENNANNGARRLRECIFRVLPPYLKTMATNACMETLERGGSNKPMAVRVSDCIAAFAALGISIDRIEARYGPSGKWSIVELANLGVAINTIKRNEISADEAFPNTVVGAAEDVVKSIKRQVKSSAIDHNAEPEADSASPSEQFLQKSLEAVGKADNRIGLSAAIDSFSKNAEAMSAEQKASFDQAVQEARARFHIMDGEEI